MSAPLRKLSEIARAVWRVPSIEWGFIQQQEMLEHLRTTKDSRSGTWNFNDAVVTGFRVVIGARYQSAVERAGEKLRPVLREALAAAGVDLATEQATLQRKVSEESALPPRPAPEDEKGELERRRAEWEGRLAAMRETAGVVERLMAWLEEDGGQRSEVGGRTEAPPAPEVVQASVLNFAEVKPADPNPMSLSATPTTNPATEVAAPVS